jgi:hypothetical protein
MTTRIRARLAAAAIMALLAASACKKSEAPGGSPPPGPTAPPVESAAAASTPAAGVAVTDVSLGKSVGADKKVQAATDTFSPKDTIFASVSTDGAAPSAIIHVKWTYGDNNQVVKEDSKSIAPTGPATTEFSIQKASGWPKGNYKVEVSVDGKSGPSKSFKVQ